MSKVVEEKGPGLINCNMQSARPQVRLWKGIQITGHCGLEREIWDSLKCFWRSIFTEKERGHWQITISLKSSSPGHSDGRAGRGWRWNLNPTVNSPVAPRELGCQISANQHEAEKSANVNKHWKPKGAKGSDIISSVICANQHFASTFLMQISNSRDVVASSPSFSCPTVQVPKRACLQAHYFIGD